MPQQVEIIGGGTVEFPDEMTPDEIKGVLKNKPPAFQPVAQTNEVPTSGVEAATQYGQQLGAPTIEEQKGLLENVPSAIRTPIEAAAETVSDFIPKSPMQAAELATPLVGGIRNIIETPPKLYDVLFGGKTVAEAFPESRTLVEAEETPPFSKERYKAGFEVLGQVGMGAAIGRGMVPKTQSLSETLGFKKETPEIVTATNEALAKLESERVLAEQKPEEVIPSASEIPSTTSVTQPEVRPQVGEGTPLRQQGKTPQTRQGTEAGTQTPETEVATGSGPVSVEKVDTLPDVGFKRAPDEKPEGVDWYVYRNEAGEVVGRSVIEGDHLSAVEVLPKFRRQGYGKQIVQDQISKGVKTTTAGSSEMVDLLKKIGAERVGESNKFNLTGERPVPADNFRKPLAEYTSTLYHEGSIDNVISLIDPNTVPGLREDLFVADTPDLATGQKANKGVLLQFKSEGIEGQVNRSKPGWEAAWVNGAGEYRILVDPATVRKNLEAITVKPDAKGSMAVRLKRVIESQKWDKTTNEDGFVTYRKPAADTGTQPVQPPPTVPPNTTTIQEPVPDTVTGIANKVTEQERKTRGLPEAAEPESRSWQQAMNEAQARDAEGANLIESLKAENNPRALNDIEDAMLLREQIKAQQAHDAAVKRVNENPNDTTAREQLEIARKRVQTIYDIDKSVGTETGRGLNARKMLADQDFTLAKMEATVRAEANGGKPLTEKQASRISELHKNIQKTDKSYQNRIRKGIEDYQKRTGEKDVSPLRPPRSVATNPVTIELLRQRDAARKAYHDMLKKERFKAQPLYRKVAHYTGEAAVGLSRSIKSAYDLSGLLRQGGLIVSGRPITGAKSIPPMLKAFASEEAQFASHQGIVNHPLYDRMRHSKLELTEPGGRISTREEAFKSELADYIPGVKASERAYTTVLNELRKDAFVSMTGLLEKWTSRKITPGEDRIVANMINVSSGRGNMGRFAPAANALAKVFWSPRLAVSRVQWLTGQPLWSNIGQGSFAVRAMIAAEYGRQLAGIGIIIGLAKMAGADIEKDPRSGNFGIRFGNTRIDVTSGLKSYINYFSRILTNKIKTQKGTMTALGEHYGSPTFLSLTANMARQKLAPGYGSLSNVLMGEQPGGQSTSLTNEMLGFYAPLSPQDVSAALQTEGVPKQVALSLLAIGGMSVQNYEAMGKKDKDRIKKRLEQRDQAFLRGDLPTAYRLTFPEKP